VPYLVVEATSPFAEVNSLVVFLRPSVSLFHIGYHLVSPVWMVLVDILVYGSVRKAPRVITVKHAPEIGVVGKARSVFERIGEVLRRYVFREKFYAVIVRSSNG
jgi:hypothetical protein